MIPRNGAELRAMAEAIRNATAEACFIRLCTVYGIEL